MHWYTEGAFKRDRLVMMRNIVLWTVGEWASWEAEDVAFDSD